MDLSNENVIHIKKENIEYLQFKKLLEYPEIKHLYSLGITRDYRTAKANNEKIDIQKYNQAIQNYKDLCNEINEPPYTKVIKANQTHSDNIKIINQKQIDKNAANQKIETAQNADSLITNEKDIILATTNADCILFLLYDTENKVIANVHSGWRGTVQRIAIKTVQKMQKEFNSKPENIICCICPSIRKCHFEVGKEVKEIFQDEFKDIDFKDASGNSIRIKSYEDDAEIGDFTNLFTDIEEGTDLDIQIWKDSEGNADMSMTSEGLRVIPTGAWAGGGIVNPLANQGETNYDLFDFSNVSKMSFKIKGTTRADSLKIYLQRNEHMDTDTGSLYPSYSTPEGTLADNGCTEIKEDEWTEVTFSVPDDFDSADYAFTFVTGDDKSGWAGTYFIVKDITYFDTNGQSVALSYVD